MYSREEVKAITDKIINMAKARRRRGRPSRGGERSGTRWANSSITTTSCSSIGSSASPCASARRRQRDDARLQRRRPEGDGRRSDRRGEGAATTRRICRSCSARRRTSPSTRRCPSGVNFGPRERARMVKESIDICEKKGVDRRRATSRRTIRRTARPTRRACSRTTASAEAGFVLTCRMADGSGSGWAGITGVKDVAHDRREGAHRSRVGQGAQEPQGAKTLEPGRYTVILEPRANARFLSLMTGIFGGGGGSAAAVPGRRRGAAVAGAPARRRAAAAARWRPRRAAVAWRWRWWWRRRRRWRRRSCRQEAGRQDLQRSVHAEERHRQSDPAADADPAATTGRRRR